MRSQNAKKSTIFDDTHAVCYKKERENFQSETVAHFQWFQGNVFVLVVIRLLPSCLSTDRRCIYRRCKTTLRHGRGMFDPDAAAEPVASQTNESRPWPSPNWRPRKRRAYIIYVCTCIRGKIRYLYARAPVRPCSSRVKNRTRPRRTGTCARARLSVIICFSRFRRSVYCRT